jgi:hypothetical protein
MATRRRRTQRARVRQLEAALADRSLGSSLTPPLPQAPPLRKSAYSMATLPVPRTTASMVEPVYPSQIPVLEPWKYAETFGAYNRGRLYAGYGSGVSFELLRLAVKRCLLLQAIHQVCSHDMLMLSRRAQTPEVLGWRVQHLAEADERVNTTTPAMQSRCDKVARLFLCPHPLYEKTFRGFLAKVMDDYLTLNRVAIELIRNYKGQVVQFRAVDAATILPTYRLLQRFISQEYDQRGPLAYEVAARLLEHDTGLPLLDSEYVCVMRGQLVGTFAPGELLVWEDMPVTDVRVLFPPSYVEKALEGVISWVYAFAYNRTYFSQGNPIEVILGITGEIQDDSFVALQEQLRENFSGIKGAWRVPLVQLPVDGQLSVLRLKENHKEMQFAEWMATLEELACSIYRVSRRRVNTDMRAESASLTGGQARQEEIEASKEESFKVHSAFLAEHFTELVHLLDPEMEFTWTGLDITNRDEEIKVEQIEVTTYRTVNELRLKHGDEPLPGKWADLPLNPLIFQAEGLTGGGGEQDGGPPGAEGENAGDANGGDEAYDPSEDAGAGEDDREDDQAQALNVGER